MHLSLQRSCGGKLRWSPVPNELGMDSSARRELRRKYRHLAVAFLITPFVSFFSPGLKYCRFFVILRNMKKKMRCIKWASVLSTPLTWYATAWISFSGFAFNVCISQMCSDFADGKESHIWEVWCDIIVELFLWTKIPSKHGVVTWGCAP